MVHFKLETLCLFDRIIPRNELKERCTCSHSIHALFESVWSIKLELRKILDLTKKWILLVVLAVLVGAAAGLVVSILQPKVYESDAELYFSSPNHTDYNSILGAQQAAKAFASLPLSNSVMQATLRTVGVNNLSVTQFTSMVNVTNNLNSQYVTVGVRYRDPKLATRLTKELVQQSMIQFEAGATDSGQTRQFLQKELSNLSIEIKNLEQEINVAQNQSSSAFQGIPVSQLRETLSADRTLYNQLLGSYNLMTDTQVTVVQDAQVPQTPFGQGKAFAIAIGAIVALVAILAVILFIEQTDDVLRTAEKVYQATGLATLMSVAYSPAVARQALYAKQHSEVIENTGATRVESVPIEHTASTNGYHEASENEVTVKLVAANASLLTTPSAQAENAMHEAIMHVEVPETPAVENHKRSIALIKQDGADTTGDLAEEFLTLGVLLSSYSSKQKTANNTGTLLITSAEKGAGKTQIATQIALGLARVGVRVVLLDANLREPEIDKIFALPNKFGFSSLLNGGAEIDSNLIASVLYKTHEPLLNVLPAGSTSVSSSALLSSPRTSEILHTLSENAVVVIDGPALLMASDAVILAKKCDNVLMIVDTHQTRTAKVKRVLEILTQVHANVLGVILNRASNKE